MDTEEGSTVKKALLLIMALMLLVPCAHAWSLLESMIREFEGIADKNFDIMCDYSEDGNVACMQLVYQHTFLDAYKLFHSPEIDLKGAFDELMLNFSTSFHDAATATGECSTSVVVAISTDNYPLAVYVNGQDLGWMCTNWDGIRPSNIDQ